MAPWVWIVIFVGLLLVGTWTWDRRARRRGHRPGDGSKDMYDDPAIRNAVPAHQESRLQSPGS